MVTIIPSELDSRQRHHLLISTVVPRPIALASTIDKNGNTNLAPFSFFNAFSSTPPILIFSPNTTVRGGRQKDTLLNIKETGEVVINIVNHQIAKQMVIAGYDFEKGVSEFEKSGLTRLKSQFVKPFRVKESPIQFECKINEVKSLGHEPGTANLVISEILAVHLHPDILDEKNRVNPKKLDVVGRLGGFGYARITPEVIFEIPQGNNLPVGFDAIPDYIKKSEHLSGSELFVLAEVMNLPSSEEIEVFAKSAEFFNALKTKPTKPDEIQTWTAGQIKKLLNQGEVEKVWLFVKAFERPR
jgi:flavin reductase (DIM6/NTAB) family NADH-FMN oxidoreductase RutF